MRTVCKNPACPRQGKPFTHERAGARYCSTACRVAAHRKREEPPPTTWWRGKEPGLSPISRSYHADGSPALSNQELGECLIKIAKQDDDGEPKTGRRFYYLALSYGHIQPDMGATDAGKKSRDAAYKRVTHLLGVLRMQGTIGWGDVLDLTRELEEWQTYESPREARAAMRRHYNEDRWIGQPHYPIFIVEKDTLEPVCKPMAMHWQMPFASSRGYGSLTLQHDVAHMLRERFARTGQPAKIYFISDLDPSGRDLQRAWQETLDNFGVRYTLVRIGLTIAQVRGIRNARLRQGIEVKASDSRSTSYIAQYGDRCWETDILPAANIEAALDTDIRLWLKRDLWDRRHREIERARELL